MNTVTINYDARTLQFRLPKNREKDLLVRAALTVLQVALGSELVVTYSTH